MKLSKFAKNFVKNTVGKVGNLPRIYNVDKAQYIIGYAEVNQMATTAFSRIRVNKGYFFCDLVDSLIAEGDLIQDRVDNKYYMIMSLKAQYLKGETAYLDSTLFFCDSTATIQRFQDGARDSFGRVVDSGPTTIYSDVKIMTSAMNYDVLLQEDRPIAQDKIKLYIQSKFAVKVADRISTNDGNVYKVISINNSDFQGINLLYVDVDVR